MAFISKKATIVYVTEEVTEGLAVAATAGSQAVSILSDGFEINAERELVERSNLNTSIGKDLPRAGLATSSLSIGVEAKGATTAGAKPEADLLFEAGLGAMRQLTGTVTSGTSHTTSIIKIADVDITKFVVGDMVLVKEAGAYHFSPIITVTTTPGAASITLLVAMGVAPTNAVVIEKFTTYYTANSGHPSLTVNAFYEDLLNASAAGCRVGSVSLEGFEVGQIPSFNFSLNGWEYSEVLGASGLTASFSGCTPPIALGACVYKSGTALSVSSLAFSLENTLAQVTSTCAGMIGQRITERVVTGSFVTEMDSASVALFGEYDALTPVSLFMYLKNPTATAGQYANYVGVYIPNVVITTLGKQDSDGLMQYSCEFSAGTHASLADLYIGFV
jgi:hypothetical protein